MPGIKTYDWPGELAKLLAALTELTKVLTKKIVEEGKKNA